MKPFYILIAVFVVSLIVTKLLNSNFDYYLSGKIALSVMLLFTSIGHFKFTKGMSLMLPEFIPFKTGIIYFTGIIEIIAAICIFVPSLEKITGILLIAFFILILPTNIYALVNFPGCSNYDEEVSKGTKFFIYSKNEIKFYVYNNQAQFQSIELKNHPKNYVLFGKIKISRTTNLADLQKAFPIAYKNYKNEKGISFLRLKFNAKWDDEIQIGIENDEVTSISYWNPC